MRQNTCAARPTGRRQRAVAEALYTRKARLAEPLLQRVRVIGIFTVLLKAARPQCTPAAEQIDAIVAAVLFFVKFRSPDAVGLVILIEEDLSVQPAQLLWRVDVEKEHAAGRSARQTR